jgi:hypothetical protein
MSDSQYWLMFERGSYLTLLGALGLVSYLAGKRWSPEVFRTNPSVPSLAIVGFVVLPLGLTFMVVGLVGSRF